MGIWEYEHAFNASGLELVPCGASWDVPMEQSSRVQLQNTLVTVKWPSLHEAVHIPSPYQEKYISDIKNKCIRLN